MSDSDFSKQLNGDSGILELMEDLGAAVNGKEDIQMLGGGNPAAIPEVMRVLRAEMEAMLAAGDAFERMVGNYDAPQGNRAFIDALGELLRCEFDWQIDADNIAITNGSQASFGVLFNLFGGRCGARDKKILLPMTPEYIGYADVGIGNGGNGNRAQKLFTANKPIIDNIDELFFKYRVDFDALNLDAHIGAICVSRPTNPTGNILTDDEVAKLRGVCETSGIPLIIDGAYGMPFPAIVFNRAKPVWDETIVLCLSLSKLGMPGARTGIVIAHRDIIAQVTRANAIFTLAPGRFGPALLTRLVKNHALLTLCRDTIAPFYRQRSHEAIELLRESMGDLPLRVHCSEGAIFLWLWFPELPIDCQQLYQRLKKRGVIVVAGRYFFPGLEDDWQHRHECIRITYAADPAQLRRGIEILGAEVRRAYRR